MRKQPNGTPGKKPAAPSLKLLSSSGSAISAHWSKFSMGESLDEPMTLSRAAALSRFRRAAAGEHFLAWRLTVKFDCDLRGHFVDGFLNFVGSSNDARQHAAEWRAWIVRYLQVPAATIARSTSTLGPMTSRCRRLARACDAAAAASSALRRDRIGASGRTDYRAAPGDDGIGDDDPMLIEEVAA